jgi:hypothetical protein
MIENSIINNKYEMNYCVGLLKDVCSNYVNRFKIFYYSLKELMQRINNDLDENE